MSCAQQHDNGRLIKSLNHLRDLGNTVIVMEHDEEGYFKRYGVDIGPGASVYDAFYFSLFKFIQIYLAYDRVTFVPLNPA